MAIFAVYQCKQTPNLVIDQFTFVNSWLTFDVSDMLQLAAFQVSLKNHPDLASQIQLINDRLYRDSLDNAPAQLGPVLIPGPIGTQGRGVSSATVDGQNHLILALTDQTRLDAGVIPTTQGVAGRGVTSVAVNSQKHLMVTLTDTTVVDAGLVPTTSGVDGVSITNVAVNSQKHLIITLSNGQSIDGGLVPTIAGAASTVAGPAGRGITSTAVNSSGHLIVTYNDGTTQDAGPVGSSSGGTGSGGGTGGGTTTPPTTNPTPTTDLAFSSPIQYNVAVPNGVTVINRTAGDSIRTTFPGLTINNASSAVTGTPTQHSGLITQTFSDSTTKNNLLFAPDGGNRAMKLGINVPTISFYELNRTFLNYLKCGQVVRAPATVDANGIPQTLAQDQYGNYNCTYLFPVDDGLSTPVKYRVITDGDIDCSIVGTMVAPFALDSNNHLVATYSGSSCRNGHNALFKITRIGSTKPTYIALVRDEEAALYISNATKGFKQNFITNLSAFSRIRFMDWTMTNQAYYVDNTPGSMTYYVPLPDGSGNYALNVPYQVQVDLCIAAGIGGWFNMHVTWSNAKFQSMWTQLDRLAGANLTAKIEYSNELWNDSFWQAATYAPQNFDATPGATIDNAYCKKFWWNGYRSAQLARLAKAAGKPYQFVIGVQPVDQNEAYSGPHYIDLGMAFALGYSSVPALSTLYADFSSWTTTTYAGGDWDQSVATIGQTRFDYQTAIAQNQDFAGAYDITMNTPPGAGSFSFISIQTYLQAAKVAANHRGLNLDAYEGNGTANGSIPSRIAIDSFFMAMIDSPLARPVTFANCEMADRGGVNEAMYFNYDSQPTDSTFGIYGVLGHPSLQGLTDFIAKTYVPASGGGSGGSGSVNYSSNFDSATTGQIATGWTNNTNTWTVKAGSGAVSGANGFGTTDGNQGVVLYSAAVVANGKIGFNTKYVTGVTFLRSPMVRVDSGFTAGYVILLNVGNQTLTFYHKNGSSYDGLHNEYLPSFTTPANNDVIAQEVIFNGTTLEYRIWNVTAGGTRPSSPSSTITDSSNSTGYCGIYDPTNGLSLIDDVVIQSS